MKNKFFKFLFTLILAFITIFSFCLNIKADSLYVYVGGDAIGLDLETGVYVTGKFDIEKNNLLAKGDIITKVNKKEVECVDELKKIIDKLDYGKVIDVSFIRNGLEMNAPVTVCVKDGKKTIGVYAKDNMLGVGTLTYVTPNTNTFGSLGHSACSDLIEVSGGQILNCYISGVKKGIRGIPGEKKAILENKIIGSVSINNDFGVFGVLNEFDTNDRDLIEVADVNDVEIGVAVIRTVVDGTKIEEYEIEITEIEKQDNLKTKGVKYKVIDEELIEKTGGIIQGMSGSPIIQNDKLIGAVSHVIINDPLVGYGVFACWMTQFS